MAVKTRKTPDADDVDWIAPYPCAVCGVEFSSRRTLARHPHPKKKETRR